jgi:hypothetical protein
MSNDNKKEQSKKIGADTIQLDLSLTNSYRVMRKTDVAHMGSFTHVIEFADFFKDYSAALKAFKRQCDIAKALNS